MLQIEYSLLVVQHKTQHGKQQIPGRCHHARVASFSNVCPSHLSPLTTHHSPLTTHELSLPRVCWQSSLSSLHQMAPKADPQVQKNVNMVPFPAPSHAPPALPLILTQFAHTHLCYSLFQVANGMDARAAWKVCGCPRGEPFQASQTLP
jgi:hypothetical protein